MSKRLPAVIASAALTLGLFVGPALPAQAVTRAQYESAVITYTNQARASHGLSSLRSKACLEKYSAKRAAWIRKHQKLKHSNLKTVRKKCKLRGVAENIAYGYPDGRSVVLDGWMNSEGHRRNILTAQHRYIGAGAYVDSRGRWWSAEILGY